MSETEEMLSPFDGQPVDFELEDVGVGHDGQKARLCIASCRFETAPDADFLWLTELRLDANGFPKSTGMYVQTEGWKKLWKHLTAKLYPCGLDHCKPDELSAMRHLLGLPPTVESFERTAEAMRACKEAK